MIRNINTKYGKGNTVKKCGMCRFVCVITMFVLLMLSPLSSFADTVDEGFSSVINEGKLMSIRGQTVDSDYLKSFMNFRLDIDRVGLQRELNKLKAANLLKEAQEKINPMIHVNQATLLSSSLYGNAKPYRIENSSLVNCYGYSQWLSWWLNPGDIAYPAAPGYLTTQARIDDYFKNVNCCAYRAIEDCAPVYYYFKGARTITGPTAAISVSEHRIALRTGWIDYDGDQHVDLSPFPEADYHWMVQNSDGTWAEKHGSQPSQNLYNVNPSTISWNLGTITGFYNSATVYLAVNNY